MAQSAGVLAVELAGRADRIVKLRENVSGSTIGREKGGLPIAAAGVVALSRCGEPEQIHRPPGAVLESQPADATEAAFGYFMFDGTDAS